MVRQSNQSLQIRASSRKRDETTGRSSLGWATLNLGQLYRRTAAYLPGRPGLRRKAIETLKHAWDILESDDKDLRGLSVPLIAIAAEDANLTFDQRIERVNRAIEYSEKWALDEIQMGSGWFQLGALYAEKDPDKSIDAYRNAYERYTRGGIKAEMARAKIELSLVMALQKSPNARQVFNEGLALMSQVQGSWEWRTVVTILSKVRYYKTALLAL